VVGIFRVTGPLQLALSLLRDFGQSDRGEALEPAQEQDHEHLERIFINVDTWPWSVILRVALGC
jgi:hypothetical protein